MNDTLAGTPLLTTTPHQQEDVSPLDRFNVHRCPTRRVFSGTGLELVTKEATIRYPYPYHSATAATRCNGRLLLVYDLKLPKLKVLANIQGVTKFHQQIQMSDSRQHGEDRGP
ncbi:uncharacterized protein TNCV_1534601 [Trichonephila clavipes]|nr:uncharacterized protein TNCV_1534601 [Trichonephila clavipes]